MDIFKSHRPVINGELVDIFGDFERFIYRQNASGFTVQNYRQRFVDYMKGKQDEARQKYRLCLWYIAASKLVDTNTTGCVPEEIIAYIKLYNDINLTIDVEWTYYAATITFLRNNKKHRDTYTPALYVFNTGYAHNHNPPHRYYISSMRQVYYRNNKKHGGHLPAYIFNFVRYPWRRAAHLREPSDEYWIRGRRTTKQKAQTYLKSDQQLVITKVTPHKNVSTVRHLTNPYTGNLIARRGPTHWKLIKEGKLPPNTLRHSSEPPCKFKTCERVSPTLCINPVTKRYIHIYASAYQKLVRDNIIDY